MTDLIDRVRAGELVADLNEYLRGCPNPNKVWPKWMVKKSSRLLWRCREALDAIAASEGVQGGE